MSKLGDIKNIEDLKAHIITLRYTLLYNEFAQRYFYNSLLKNGKTEEFLSQELFILPEGKITFKNYVESLEKKSLNVLNEVIKNASRTIARNYFKECYRIVESYCYESKQENLLKNQRWYEFYRIITNSLSHDFKLKFNKKDKKVLPLNYGSFILDNTLEGKRLDIELNILLEINLELIEFVMNDLK